MSILGMKRETGAHWSNQRNPGAAPATVSEFMTDHTATAPDR